jgi:uncharacterized protein YjbI with pentapeptide repeats
MTVAYRSNSDFSGADLTEFSLKASKFHKTMLCKSDLGSTEFERSNLTVINLQEAYLKRESHNCLHEWF